MLIMYLYSRMGNYRVLPDGAECCTLKSPTVEEWAVR